MGEEAVSDVMEEDGPLNFAAETSPRTVRENADLGGEPGTRRGETGAVV